MEPVELSEHRVPSATSYTVQHAVRHHVSDTSGLLVPYDPHRTVIGVHFLFDSMLVS